MNQINVTINDIVSATAMLGNRATRIEIARTLDIADNRKARLRLRRVLRRLVKLGAFSCEVIGNAMRYAASPDVDERIANAFLDDEMPVIAE